MCVHGDEGTSCQHVFLLELYDTEEEDKPECDRHTEPTATQQCVCGPAEGAVNLTPALISCVISNLELEVRLAGKYKCVFGRVHPAAEHPFIWPQSSFFIVLFVSFYLSPVNIPVHLHFSVCVCVCVCVCERERE